MESPEKVSQESQPDASSGDSPFTKVHYDFSQLPLHVSPWRQLQLRGVALGLIHLPPGEGYTFTHSHTAQEEVYAVIEGQGLLVVDGELIPLERGDLVRVSPQARRALRAADQTALLIFCAGGVAEGYPKTANARYLIDDGIPHYEDIPPWYAGDRAVEERNAQLKARMLKSQAKRQSQGDVLQNNLQPEQE
ncbi:cupin domain-containing protein [Leptolyngbya ohadii]|uniref:cupin domain-containing protein n=1 Tax=Leptolyngbya ohadii TaxID=1962290 RepID=UPI000B59AECE|nr:cupin domain-containing protein [Leptolyngbya ohadii]